MATTNPTPTGAKVTTAGSTTGATSVLTATGTTVINDGVVAKIAGIAAREVSGVFALGGGAARALGAIRSVVNADDLTQGISVEVGETQVAVDVTIVAEYPMPLQTIADGVRASVINAIETLVGMQVTEVNVTVNDVHIPGDDKAEEATEARVL